MKSLNPKITDWRERRVWIIGASSGIGAALAKKFLASGAEVALSARRESALESVAGTQGVVLPCDVSDPAGLETAMSVLLTRWGGIDMVVYCAGVYTPMRAWEVDLKVVRETLAINLQGVYNLLYSLVPVYIERNGGGLCLVSSVAGYTGLPKALAYGPGKAALINLAQILYSELSPYGVGVHLVNPGFVETRLTQQNDFTMPALITPDAAAQAIVAGMAKGRFEIHFPKRFTLWMKLLGLLPDRIRFHLLSRAVES